MWMARSSDTETIFDPDELYRAHQTYMSNTENSPSKWNVKQKPTV